MPRTPALRALKKPRGGFSQVGEILRQRLTSGTWQPNDRLPTEKELAEELKVCTATIQRHLRELQNEGLIWGQRGKGRFVVGLGQRPRTGSIGVVLFDSRHMANPATSELVAAVGAVAAEAELNLRIFIGNELRTRTHAVPSGTVPRDARFLGSPASMAVDGLILLTQRVSVEAVSQLAAIVPVVSSNLLPLPNVSCIAMDAAAGAMQAVRHLLELGHRKMALFTKDFHDSFGRAVREGARLATAGSNSAEELEFLTPAEFSRSEGYRLGKELLTRPDRPTAIVCGDHEMAIGVLEVVDELGLRLPDDLSLVSWNNVLAERSPVSITSLVFDRTDVGSRLCNRLLECIEHPEKRFEPEYASPVLLVRQSTGAPPTNRR